MKIILSNLRKTSLGIKDNKVKERMIKFTFYIVVRADSTPEDTPGRYVKYRVSHPLGAEVAQCYPVGAASNVGRMWLWGRNGSASNWRM